MEFKLLSIKLKTIVPNNYEVKLKNIYGISVNLDNGLPYN
jgi:hypothetical protein